MKKTNIVWMVMVLAGVSQAGVIYSNNFSGTEFTTGTIPVGTYNMAQNSATGTLESNQTGGTRPTNQGFRVDLTSLDHGTFGGIKVSADIFIPVAERNLFMGFGNQAGDWKLANNGDGFMQLAAPSQKVMAYGGQGIATNKVLESGVGMYPTGTTFRAEFTYYTNNMIDVVVNGSTLASGLAVVSSVVGGNTLDYVFLTLHQQNAGEGQFDNLVIETIGETIITNTSPGVFSINAFNLSDAGGGALAASVGLSSTNSGDIAFVLEYTPDLVHSNWVPVATNVLQAPGGTLAFTNNVTGSAGFYRISVAE